MIDLFAELFDEQAQLADYNAAREKEIKAEGKAERNIEIALNLLSFGTMSKEDISRITELTFEKVTELAAQTSEIPE